jgi:hypothetical protein
VIYSSTNLLLVPMLEPYAELQKLFESVAKPSSVDVIEDPRGSGSGYLPSLGIYVSLRKKSQSGDSDLWSAMLSVEFNHAGRSGSVAESWRGRKTAGCRTDGSGEIKFNFR